MNHRRAFLHLAALFVVASLLLAACGHHGHRVCTGGQRMVGKSCACPLGTKWSHGTCQGTPEAGNCSGGAIQYRTECLCPDGTAWITQTGGAAQCVALQCTGGSYASGNECVCGAGTSWDGTQCSAQVASAPPPPSPVTQCPEGTIATQDGCLVVGGTPTEPPPSGGTPSEPPPGQITQPVQAQPQQPPPAQPVIVVVQQPPHGGGGRPSHGQGYAQPPPPPPTVTYASCTNGMVRQGNGCACPQGTVWENGKCQIACGQGQFRERNGQCACPKDTRWNGQRCELWMECKGGSVRLGSGCICPAGTRWEQNRCAQIPQPPPQQQRPAQPPPTREPAQPGKPPSKRGR